MTDNLAAVRGYVSIATLALLAILTVASVVNLHDMAEATHAANWLTAWIIAVAIGCTLSVLAYVASITDGTTRTVATAFAVVAAGVSATLQVSLFVERGAAFGVALAFGAGVPFFEVALAWTDSMLRRYAVATPAIAPVAAPVAVLATPRRVAKVEPVATPAPEPVAAPPVAPEPTVAMPAAPEPDKRAIAQEMLQQGKPKTEIARTLQVNPSTVHRWLAQTNGAAA